MLDSMLLASLLEDAKMKSLTEASKKDDADAADDAGDTDAPDANADDAPDADNPDDAENNDDNPDENQDDENTDNDDENKEDDNNDENKDDQPDEDDFNLDDDTPSEDDNDPNPDGLPNPDDMGDDDINEDNDVETNVHTNILDLSKLDRALAKRKCYQDFMDLRATIAGMLNIIDRNETVIEPETRDDTIMELNKLNASVEEYIKYRFSIVNYEDALQHYFIFVKSMNSIINTLKEAGLTKN